MKGKNRFREYKEKGSSFLEGNKLVVFIFMILIIILGIVKIYYTKNKSLTEEQKTMEIINELTSDHFDDDEGSRVFEAVMLANKEKTVSLKDSIQFNKLNNQLDKELSRKRSKSSFESTVFALLSFLLIIGCYLIFRKLKMKKTK